MKALWIRFVLFFIGPAIRAEIAIRENEQAQLRSTLIQQACARMDSAATKRDGNPSKGS